MTQPIPPHPKLQGTEKLAVELGPVLVFMLSYFQHKRVAPFVDSILGSSFFSQEGNQLFLALALFMPVFIIAFGYSVWKERRVAPMLLVTGVILLVFGSMTLIFQDKTFFYIKLTILYSLFAAILGGGLLFGQNYLKVLFDGAFHLPDNAWRTLTWRFVGFFAVVAIANEFVWRTLIAMDMESTYITLKMIGVPVVYLGFMLFQAPLLAKHMPSEGSENKQEQEKSKAPDVLTSNTTDKSKQPNNTPNKP